MISYVISSSTAPGQPPIWTAVVDPDVENSAISFHSREGRAFFRAAPLLMLGMGCHQRVCPSVVKGFLWRYFLRRLSWLKRWLGLFWNMLWLSHLLCLSACCSWIVTLYLGACIFRHIIRLRVMTFTGYLWKCRSGHDTALYTVCCTSVCALTQWRLPREEVKLDLWWLLAPNMGCFMCLFLPAGASRIGNADTESKVQQVTCLRAQTALWHQ